MEKSQVDFNTLIGRGGEADIYAVHNRPELAAKIYRKLPSDDDVRKFTFMVANPPIDPSAQNGRVSIAWLLELVTDSGRVIGFAMSRLDLEITKEIFNYYIPATRRQQFPLFSYFALVRTAQNLSRAVRSVHSRGYVIGDVNESNVLVAEDAIITLVDTDSFQFNDGITTHRCTMGKPEYTPPELQGFSFRDVDRLVEHDLFGLGVLIFQLLMEGTHPFDGVFTGQGEAPEIKNRIKSGHFPHGKRSIPYKPKPLIYFQMLPIALQELFLLCFEEGHRNPAARPTADMWVNTLGEFENNLTKCSVNEQHFYSNHLSYCPWCERTAKLSGLDPFPSVAAVKSGQHLKPIQNTKVAATSTNKSSPAPTNPYGSPQQPLKPQYSTPNVSSSPPVKQRQSWGLLTRVIVTIPFCMILAVFLWQTFGAVMMRITSPSATKQNLTTTDYYQKTQETELLQAIEAKTGELVNLFVGNLPVSVIIDDIKKRTPITVQVDAITQTSAAATAQSTATSAISLSGKATSYNELNDFLQLLKASPLLKAEETVLVSSTLQPATADRNFTLVNFQIRTVVTSPTETLPYLQKIGADGLVTRINLLKQQGVILANKSNIAQTIEEANQRNIFVLSLLPPVDNIDTLIRDIQEQIPRTIVFAVPPDFSYELAETLRTFQPTAPVIGLQYNTYSFTVGFDGKFEDVLNTIQKIERLKPLLIVKDLKLTKKALPTNTFKFSRPFAAGKEKDILDNLPPLLGADFTIQVFVPKTLEEIKATANPPKRVF